MSKQSININRFDTPIYQAKELGMESFRAGRPCAPALHPELIAMFDKGGISNADLMRAWISGWTSERLAAEMEP